uniref:Reverse transcriptase domain-containing protein n=1 Tax=Tanacetum cinerariifolium TaxID=118510 RepID=A0A6L2LVA8_TANCI|nr:reverse transcriptase domain-containing protein [Tanacetum cinerariifolium]
MSFSSIGGQLSAPDKIALSVRLAFEQCDVKITEINTIVFSTVSSVISRFPSIRKIRRKPHSLAHTERLLIAACLLSYAMHKARFRELSLPFRKDAEELEHKAYWALKHANFDMKIAGDHKKVQLNKLCDQAYENSHIYKEKTNRLHDSKINDRVFNINDIVLLFNSHLKIISGKLKSRWSGPFTISHVYSYGTVELSQPDEPDFKVNGNCLKHYFREDVPKLVVPNLQTFPKDY